jgi:hypothetical protein
VARSDVWRGVALSFCLASPVSGAPKSGTVAESDWLAGSRRLASLEASSAELSTRAQRVRGEAQPLLARRAELKASMQALRRELSRHLEVAAKARKSHERAVKSQKPGTRPPPTTQLESARSEYRLASDKGKALQRQLEEARAVEQKLESLAVQAREVEAQGSALVSEARNTEARVNLGLNALGNAGARFQSAAARARSQAGFAQPSAYTAVRAKSDKALAGVDAALALVGDKQKQLVAQKRALTSPAGAPAAAVPAASPAAAAAPEAGWVPLFPSPPPVTAPAPGLNQAEITQLTRRLFGPKFLASSAACTLEPGQGDGTVEQARRAGQFAPLLLAQDSGAFTRAGAKETLLLFSFGECNQPRAKGPTARFVVIEGGKVTLDLEQRAALIDGLAGAHDVDGDGVMEVLVQSGFSGQGQSNTDLALASLKGGRFTDSGNTWGYADSCGSGMPGASATAIRVFVRPGPKPEFKVEETETPCEY